MLKLVADFDKVHMLFAFRFIQCKGLEIMQTSTDFKGRPRKTQRALNRQLVKLEGCS